MDKATNRATWRGFWDNLPKPIFALAPMYDVTDAAFRRIIAKYGKPDVFYTEFVSTDGLMSEGYDRLINHLWFDTSEHPIVAQVFGTKPDKFEQTAMLAAELGFDGFDINMGCPDKGIIKTGSCAGLFHNPQLAKEIVLASQRGAEAAAKKLGKPVMPVSVKIRIGDTKIDWQNWIATLLEAQPAAIAIHLRTRKEMSKVDAHWDEMPKIVQFINEQTTPETRPLIIGNGDVKDLNDARIKIEQAGCDGAMLGRAIFGNPWLFTNKEEARAGKEINFEVSREQKLATLLEHVQLYNQLFTGVKPFDVMKRHFKAYIHGFDGAAELRAELYECKTAGEVEAIIKKHN